VQLKFIISRSEVSPGRPGTRRSFQWGSQTVSARLNLFAALSVVAGGNARLSTSICRHLNDLVLIESYWKLN
jgi:hypothetical protein